MPYARTTTGPHVATELVALYRRQLEGCRLQRGESCLIVTDTAYQPTASAACLGAALDLGASAAILTLPYSLPFPGSSLAATLAKADLIVGVTTHRLLSCATAPLSPGLVPLMASLFALGLGWNLCYIGGSVLLGDRLSAAEKARTQGMKTC